MAGEHGNGATHSGPMGMMKDVWEAVGWYPILVRNKVLLSILLFVLKYGAEWPKAMG